MYSDVLPIRGALSGLYTALYYSSNPLVGIVACDMVFPSAPLLLAERDALAASDADVAIPHTSHGYEPFHAVYRRETCLPLVKAALDAGEIRANSWFEQSGARLLEFTQEMVLAADPRGGAFVNINTPAELAGIESKVLTKTMPELCSSEQ
jgi:molybdopterin-guanine dinucleotide biosynthesis protein A